MRAAAGTADDGPNASLREGGREAGYGATLGAPRGRAAPPAAGQGPARLEALDSRTVTLGLYFIVDMNPSEALWGMPNWLVCINCHGSGCG